MALIWSTWCKEQPEDKEYIIPQRCEKAQASLKFEIDCIRIVSPGIVQVVDVLCEVERQAKSCMRTHGASKSKPNMESVTNTTQNFKITPQKNLLMLT